MLSRAPLSLSVPTVMWDCAVDVLLRLKFLGLSFSIPVSGAEIIELSAQHDEKYLILIGMMSTASQLC